MNEIPHVIMVTHGNRIRCLRQTIPAVMATDHLFELTVVANRATGSALAYLKQNQSRFNLMVNDKNVGFAIAANQAWQSRASRYTVHLGDDCLARDPDWLRKLVDIADCCPEVGIVGHSVEATWPLRVLGKGGCRRTVQVQPSNLGGIILIPYRTEALIGLYNEEMGQYGEEDALYGWKVRHAGLLCVYFDHNVLGRSFDHIGGLYDTDTYKAKKANWRSEAIPIRDELIKEYEAGRPLSS